MEANGAPFERRILQIDALENLSLLKSLRLEKLPALKAFADGMKSLSTLPEANQKYFRELAHKDFMEKLKEQAEIVTKPNGK